MGRVFLLVRVEHRVERILAQVGESHDARAGTGRPIGAGGGELRDQVHHLGLAHRPKRLRPVRRLHPAALQEHGGDDVVAGRQIRDEFVEQVTALRAVMPEVVMRIDDRQSGLDDVLMHLREPVGPHGRVVVCLSAAYCGSSVQPSRRR